MKIKKGSLANNRFENRGNTLPCYPAKGNLKMLERTIERRLVEKAKDAGGLAMKWVSPAFAGVPDRIVFLPGGRIIFIELKAPGKTLAPLQERVHKMLASLGADVRTIDSPEGVDGVFE